MSTNKHTTDSLVAAVRRRGSIPDVPNTTDDEAILAYLNDELQISLVPLLMSVREEYFVAYRDYPISNPSQQVIVVEIPSDAVGMKLRDVHWVNPGTGTSVPVPRTSLENMGNGFWDINFAYGFRLEGNKVIVSPGSNGTGTLRLYYMARPLDLTLTTTAGRVVSVNPMTNEVQLSNVPNDWVPGTEVNVVQNKQPFSPILDADIVSLSAPTINLSSVEGIEVGQWISLKGMSPFVQLPVEALNVLVQATVVKCLEALGDREGMAVAQSKLSEQATNMNTMLSPRVDGAPKKILPTGGALADYVGGPNIRRRW